LGTVVADVSYWFGNICDNHGNSVNSRLGGRGMHTLGISLWWEFLLQMVVWSVVTLCHCGKNMMIAASGWVTAGKRTTVVKFEVLGY